MAANTSQTLLTLDFATYKASLKTYLKNNPVFKDYEFEGPNLSVLLDILAYNTFQTGFYTNMALSESFLDSAQLRSSVVSHAKDLNYLPVSAKSPKAQVNVVFTATGASAPYTIPKGSSFSTIIKNKSYVFNTDQNIIATYTGSGNTFYFTADIYEGLYANDPFVFQTSSDPQKFKLTNQNIDTDSLVVTVFENGSQYGDEYIKTDTLLGLDENSKIYFIQATADGYYEILFGDNIFGHKPLDQSLINVNYRVTDGAAANGSKLFSVDFDPTGVGELTSTPTATTLKNAQDGTDKESIESVRVYAPRYFATQQRAVSSDDYASIILAKFPSAIDDVNVYGGETLNPKQYGRVVIALKPKTQDGSIVPDSTKQQISNMLLNYIAIPSKAILTDPDYFYISVESTVQYDAAKTTKLSVELQTVIQTAMTTFAAANLEKFGKDFRYSRFVSTIDSSDDSIVSNDTTVQMIKRLTPVLNTSTNYVIQFNNAAGIGTIGDTAFSEEAVLTSSFFTYVDMASQQVYESCYIQDDSLGKLAIFSSASDTPVLINPDTGSINYTTGEVQIDNFISSDYTNHISLYLKLATKDIIVQQKNILMLDLADVAINLIPMVD